MAVDPQIVKARLREIEECVLELRQLGGMNDAAFVEDRKAVRATERLFQVAIQSLLDIGTHLIAELGLREPDAYAAVIEILGEEGVIPEDFAKRIRGMAGLRNVLVHDYLRVDPAILRQYLVRLDDFEDFCRFVLAYLKL